MGLFKSSRTKTLENMVRARYINETLDSFDLDEKLEQMGIDYDEWSEFCNKYIKERAYAGDVDCQALYGSWQRGKNDTEAVSFLERAANSGSVKAMESLAIGYSEVGSLETDRNKELFWIIKAADAGSTSEMLALAREYMIGDGIEKNYDLAEKYLQKASQKGSADAYAAFADLPKYQNDEARIQIFRNVFKFANISTDTMASTFIRLGSIYRTKDTPNYNPRKAKYCYFMACMADPQDCIAEWYHQVEYETSQQEFEQWKADYNNRRFNMSLM